MNGHKKLYLSIIFALLFWMGYPFPADAGHEHGTQLSESMDSKQEGPKILEYILPTKNSLPYGIGLDSKGRVWYTAQLANRVGYLDPKTGQVKEFKIPSAASLPESDWKYDPVNKTTPKPEDAYNIFSVGSPGELVVDSRDRVWFVQVLGNSIGMFDPESEEFKEYEVPTPNSQPYSLAVDSENNVWFVERNANKIGKLDFSAKKITEYSMPGGTHRLSSIAIDGKQNIWITDIMDNSIGMFLAAEGKIKRYPIYENVSQPQSAVIGPTGRVWFALAKAHKIAMLDLPSERISYALLPDYNSVPQDLAVDASERVWYVDSMRNKIGGFDPQNARFVEWDIPTTNAQPMQMAIDPNGDIWFTESDRGANKLGRLIASSTPKGARTEGAKPLKSSGATETPGTNEGGKKAVPWWIFGLIAGGVLLLALRFFRK